MLAGFDSLTRNKSKIKNINTGIEAINNEQLIINNEDDAVYDLSGRKITAAANSSLFILHSSLKKGIYIVNGKKIAIK